MHDSILFPLLLQAALICLNAVFACAEIAVISMNDLRIAQLASQGDKRAVRLARLTNRPARFLATIQIAVTLSGFLGSAFAADNFSDRLAALLVRAGVPISEGTLDTLAVILITLVLSYFTLVFGELVPKRLAMKKAESLALGLSALVSAISTLFAPIVAVLTASTNLILRLFGVDPNADEEEISEEEIRMMVARGGEKGVFDQATTEFIQNVFAFDDLPVGEFVTHRTELTLLWTHQSVKEWREAIHASRHTRYPVCDKTVDNIVGILDARDFFRLDGVTVPELVASYLKPAFLVPETVKADKLFQQMKQRRNYYAVVLDEHGGMLGVVTINDLLEQLVGEFEVEGDSPDIELVDQDTWRIRGYARLEDVALELGVALPEEEYETFGGYVFGLYGSVPADGRKVTVRTPELVIRVDLIKGHKLEAATVRKRHTSK